MKLPNFSRWLDRGKQVLEALEALPGPSQEEVEQQEAKDVHKALAEAFSKKTGQREELCLLAWLGLRREEEALLNWAEARYPAWVEEKAQIQLAYALLKERLLLVRCSYKAEAPTPPSETPVLIRREIQIFALVAGKPTKLALETKLPWSDFPERLCEELSSPSSEVLFTLYKKEKDA